MLNCGRCMATPLYLCAAAWEWLTSAGWLLCAAGGSDTSGRVWTLSQCFFSGETPSFGMHFLGELRLSRI